MQRLAFFSSLPFAAWCECLGGNVFLTSYFNKQLEDREGAVGLDGDKGDYQKWTISDATPYGGSGRVVLTSHFGAHLEDRDGTVGLHPDTAEYQWWSVQCADDGRIFLISHRGVQLEDREGSLGLNGDRAEWQMWRVLQDGPLTQCTCDDFPSGPTPPPTPPPPPAPTPGPLPPIPEKLWFGMFGSSTDGSVSPYTFSSVLWDIGGNPSDDTIQQYGGPECRFLYPVSKFFCGGDDWGGGACSLLDDYQARWDAVVPQMQDLLQSQKMLGFWLGDERVCGGKRPIEPVITMANAIRNSFPRGSAIIYTNECGGLFGDGVKVPDAVDWISLDHYRGDTKDGFIKELKKDYYEKLVYPMMADHQKVAIIPQVGHPKDNFKICDDECTAKVELQDAHDAVDWAHTDSRVALVAPYRWRADGKVEVGLDQLDHADDLKKFWIDFGTSTRGSSMLANNMIA